MKAITLLFLSLPVLTAGALAVTCCYDLNPTAIIKACLDPEGYACESVAQQESAQWAFVRVSY